MIHQPVKKSPQRRFLPHQVQTRDPWGKHSMFFWLNHLALPNCVVTEETSLHFTMYPEVCTNAVAWNSETRGNGKHPTADLQVSALLWRLQFKILKPFEHCTPLRSDALYACCLGLHNLSNKRWIHPGQFRGRLSKEADAVVYQRQRSIHLLCIDIG